MISSNKINAQLMGHKTTLCNIYKSMKPINTACKIFGLNVITLTEKGHFQSDKTRDLIYLVFYFCTYTALTIVSLTFTLLGEESLTVANKYIVIMESCVMTTFMLIAVICTFSFRNLQIKALDLLAHVDVAFVKNGYKLKYTQLLKKNYIVLIAVSVSLLLRSVFVFLASSSDIIQQVTLVLSAAIKAFSKYQFVVFVLQLQLRFRRLNWILQSFYNTDKKLVLDPDIKIIPNKLYMLCRLHYKLASVLQKINVAFAVQLLASIAVSIFDILYQSYYLYNVATGKTTVNTVAIIVNPILWLIDEIMEIYWLVDSCADTCDQANDTPTILHELRNSLFDLDLEYNIQTFSLQMLHQKVQFSVLGFFVIDYTLIYSIAGAVTTYLVIFIQFDQSSAGENSVVQNSTI